jgi:hypothetical protein
MTWATLEPASWSDDGTWRRPEEVVAHPRDPEDDQRKHTLMHAWFPPACASLWPAHSNHARSRPTEISASASPSTKAARLAAYFSAQHCCFGQACRASWWHRSDRLISLAAWWPSRPIGILVSRQSRVHRHPHQQRSQHILAQAPIRPPHAQPSTSISLVPATVGHTSNTATSTSSHTIRIIVWRCISQPHHVARSYRQSLDAVAHAE